MTTNNWLVKVVNWLATVALLLISVVIGVFSLGSVVQYKEQMQHGLVTVFLGRISFVILVMGIVAASWWGLNWLLKRVVRQIINLKMLAIQLGVVMLAGSIIGAALYCWH